MDSNKLLIVEDDPNLGQVLSEYLTMKGYTTHLAQNGEEGMEVFRSEHFNMIILDIMMPKKDGFTLAREIREEDKRTPIIFLTAKALNEDIVQGLKIGADDYITKPFNSEELLLRVQAVLKRSQNGGLEDDDQRTEFEFGNFTFDFPLRTLTYRDGTQEKVSKLSPKEAQLLRLFCINLNNVLTRSEALTKIWGEDNYFTARSMDVFVTKLRKYLKIDDNIEIVNIHGNGFQLLVKDSVE